MYVSISGSMSSSHYPSHLTYNPLRRQSTENLSFTAYCTRRSAFSTSYSRRKRMPKETKEKARRARVLKRKMEMKNLKLYIENKSIIEANEKLRIKAALLHLENLALQSQLQINSPVQLGLLPN